jgi:hypothetical protein
MRANLDRNWILIERQFIYYYTGQLPNLGAHTTQRNERLMTAREAAEFDLKQQERVASLKRAPASFTSTPLLGPLNSPQHPTATTRTTRRVRRPTRKVQEAQEVAAARGLKRMATAMADGEGAVEGLEGCGGDMAVL